MTTDGEWQVVSRRRKYPDNWRFSKPQQPTVKPYIPYTSYAEVVRRHLHPSSPSRSTNSSPKTTPPTSRPASPNAPPATLYFVSPHSPSRLRFPPSSTFSEWKGRCFRCCRTGHTRAKCRNPRRCGRCWSYGHIGSQCNQPLIAPPQPTTTKRVVTTVPGEPGFEELLAGPYPHRAPPMPTDRPLRMHCFIERDDEYYQELNRLKNAVVMNTREFQWDLSVENVADYAVKTGTVSREEIQVTELYGSRFLIVLPEGLDPDTFINATPQSAWDEGLNFQPWSPLDDAAISVPTYKVLMGLSGIPPHLWRETAVSQAVSKFGLYLGSVEPENPASITTWVAAVAVDDLSLVPIQLTMHVGSTVHTANINTITWERVPLYSASEMPRHPKKYTRPQSLPASLMCV